MKPRLFAACTPCKANYIEYFKNISYFIWEITERYLTLLFLHVSPSAITFSPTACYVMSKRIVINHSSTLGWGIQPSHPSCLVSNLKKIEFIYHPIFPYLYKTLSLKKNRLKSLWPRTNMLMLNSENYVNITIHFFLLIYNI